MAEMYLHINEDVYDAVLDLQKRLQDEYGDDVTISDTIDFLGHQFFVHQRLLDVASVQLKRMAEERTEPTILDKMLGAIGVNMPADTTCFIKTDIEVPLHWVSTRWLMDIEGANVLKCLSEPEEKAKPEEKTRKKGEYKIDVR
jgi:hypothetical protein